MSKKILISSVIFVTFGLLYFVYSSYKENEHRRKVVQYANQMNHLIQKTQYQLDSISNVYDIKVIEAINSPYPLGIQLSMIHAEEEEKKGGVYQKFLENKQVLVSVAKDDGVTEEEYMKYVDEILIGI